MSLLDNPERIEKVPYDWDWPLRDVILHARGAGRVLPDPEVRFWRFKNGYGAAARTSRAMLLAGLTRWDLWTLLIRGENATFLDQGSAEKLGLPEAYHPQLRLRPDEAEEFLAAVKGLDTPSPSE